MQNVDNKLADIFHKCDSKILLAKMLANRKMNRNSTKARNK